ncbi:MAG: hypothetical protein HY431_02625, partial [Candidatus Levybacteria bacterium]|nr:hypothetical protein [Candidatus Levybacteria bacterium]
KAIIIQTTAARSPSYAARLNGVNSVTDTLYQDVAIPAAATNATFSYWLRIDSDEDPADTTLWDTLKVQVRDPSTGAVLATLATFSNVDESAYTQKTADLTAYKGQTIRIYFQGITDSIYQTTFYVDDTTLTSTTSTTTTATQIIFSARNGEVQDYSSTQNSIILINTVTNGQKTIQFNKVGVVTGILEGSSIKIYAYGTAASGIYPIMELRINDSIVQTWSVTGTIQEYSYNHPTIVVANQIKVAFTNDAWTDADRNLFVDRINLNGVNYQSESPTTYTHYYNPGCASGYLLTEWLWCDGFFQYDMTTAPTPTPIN